MLPSWGRNLGGLTPVLQPLPCLMMVRSPEQRGEEQRSRHQAHWPGYLHYQVQGTHLLQSECPVLLEPARGWLAQLTAGRQAGQWGLGVWPLLNVSWGGGACLHQLWGRREGGAASLSIMGPSPTLPK